MEDFFSNVAHVLRTPMNSIIGFSDLLADTNLDDTQKEYLTNIVESSHSMNDVLNDILELIQIDIKDFKFHNTDFNLKEVIEKSCEGIEKDLQQRSIRLDYEIAEDVSLMVHADYKQVKKIFDYILANASGYTEKGNIKLRISLDPLNESGKDFQILHCSLSDTGAGIPKEELYNVFNAFVKLKTSVCSNSCGAGLGLTIVKNLVEMMNGKIWIKSELGVGTEISFNIKLKLSDKKVEEVQTFADDILFGKKILVVEDNTANQELIKNILEQFGCVVDIAENGKVGVKKVQENVYDLCLMDLKMSVMDGIDATRKIRNKLKNNMIILALTAASFEKDIHKALDAGLNDYILKPISANVLKTKILHWLTQSDTI